MRIRLGDCLIDWWFSVFILCWIVSVCFWTRKYVYILVAYILELYSLVIIYGRTLFLFYNFQNLFHSKFSHWAKTSFFIIIIYFSEQFIIHTSNSSLLGTDLLMDFKKIKSLTGDTYSVVKPGRDDTFIN